jgi:hypothetical protein
MMKAGNRPIGPNLKELMILRVSVVAVPHGAERGAALKFICQPGGMTRGFRDALAWCDQAINLVRTAAEPNPWKDASEEVIAGEVLRRVKERKAADK